MASIRNKQTQLTITLHVNHTFGRDILTNITLLENPEASRNHAIIAWDGETWRIKDASSNGTFVNQTRINSASYEVLLLGSKIQFGTIDTDIYEVSDLNPPETGLIPLNENLAFIPLHDVVILPIEQTDIMLYLSEEAHWLCEENGQITRLHPGDKVGYAEQIWQFVDGHPSTATAITTMSPPPNDIKFNFTASQNEEHISLSLVVDNKEFDLGERNHHYLLLLLARQRLDDIEKGLQPSEQGWLDKDILINMSGIIEQHINIQIYRFRKQVATVMPHSTTLHQVIERRPGELRFAYSDILIEGGFSLAKSM
ncbi:FHA domain-containing protein [Paraglaciecola sp.]|uniref:FHA domain-containing protein n=1 Tax=Paraglaciecola sp. TaxID=1920173 RepID=UPI0030F4A7F8